MQIFLGEPLLTTVSSHIYILKYVIQNYYNYLNVPSTNHESKIHDLHWVLVNWKQHAYATGKCSWWLIDLCHLSNCMLLGWWLIQKSRLVLIDNYAEDTCGCEQLWATMETMRHRQSYSSLKSVWTLAHFPIDFYSKYVVHFWVLWQQNASNWHRFDVVLIYTT